MNNRLSTDLSLPRAMPAGLVLAAIPLALASNSLLGGVALGASSGMMLGLALLLRIGFRRAVPPEIHLPVAALVLAGAMSVLDRFLDAYLHALHPAIGGALPLVAGAGLLLALACSRLPGIPGFSPLSLSAFRRWSAQCGSCSPPAPWRSCHGPAPVPCRCSTPSSSPSRPGRRAVLSCSRC